MKKCLSVVLIVILIFSLSTCGGKGSSVGDYYDGYAEGYADGASDVRDSISSYAEERFNDIDVSDAIRVLINYVDGGSISEDELHDAIWTVEQFYNDAWDVIWELDDHTID